MENIQRKENKCESMTIFGVKIYPWTIGLLLLVIVDSIVTSYIGTERNPLILWTMEKFNLTLNQAMVVRIFYLIPFIAILNSKPNMNKFVFFLYLSIYFILVQS